jgi:biotin-dependent carboxylase-like uncharacterized protein
MDRRAFVIANRLAGNADGAAALECTLVGPRFVVDGPCAIAVTGAAMPVTINGREAASWTTLPIRAGDEVRVGQASAAVRGYVAFAGGIDAPLVLGSRATYLRGRLGGLDGRALRKQDVLNVFPTSPAAIRQATAESTPAGDLVLTVVMGPQAERFTDEGVQTFLGSAYETLPQSDRMGARLRGPRIAHARGHDIISDGIALGSVQVPGDGQPIILLVDRQSTGGYTKIATVCSFDIDRVGQLRPGARVRFEAVTLAEAHRRRREHEAALAAVLT